MRIRTIAVLITIVCGSLTAAGCAFGGHPAATASGPDFAGVWVDRDDISNWLVITRVDHGYRVSIEVADELGNASPTPASATLVPVDGRLVVPAKLSFARTALAFAPVPGGMSASAVVDVKGLGTVVETTVTYAMVRSSAAAHQKYLDGLVADYRQQQLDTATQSALYDLMAGVMRWSDRHDGKFPLPSAVREGGAVGALLKKLGKPWPTLPDGTPLRPGRKKDQFVYTASSSTVTITLFGPGGAESLSTSLSTSDGG